MKVPQLLKAIAVASLLPCVGVAVATVVATPDQKQDSAVADETSPVKETSAESVPAPVVRETTADVTNWYQAGTGKGEQRIESVVRAHWATLDESGDLNGKISSIVDKVESLKPAKEMYLFLARGETVVDQVVSTAKGEFKFADVQPGSYSIVARNADGFLAFGFNVLPHSKDNGRELNIDAAIVPVAFETIALGNGVTEPIAAASLAPTGTTRFNQTVETTFGAQEFDTAVPATSIVAQKIALTEDGRMIGRVRKIDHHGNSRTIANADVVILDGLEEVGRATTDKLGVFEVKGLEAKPYSLIASATEGFAAVGFELITAEEAAGIDASGGTYSSIQTGGCCSACDVGLAGPIRFGGGRLFRGGLLRGFGGGGGGGLFGGGGGGIFSSRLARWALIGGVAAGIAVAVSDDGGNDPPASPTTP